MKEFASASIMRALNYGIRAQGLTLASWPQTSGAHIPLADKRQIIGEVVSEHGALALLRATDGASLMPREPLSEVLLASSGIEDLMDRWRRLERFAHSAHRVMTHSYEGQCVVFEHVAPNSDTVPSWFEDVVVFGVVTNLCELIGARGVVAGPALEGDNTRILPWRSEGRWTDADPAISAQYWGISFQGFETSLPNRLTEVQDTSIAGQVRGFVLQDPVRRWALAEMASVMHLSRRSLQRHLTAENQSLSTILLQARLEHATKLLQDGAYSIAQIGFMSGFSDQAHFTRMFKRFTGITPAHFAKNLL